jgi:hypothetical protein
MKHHEPGVEDSPVVITGDSYSKYNCGQGAHLAAQVALRIGLPLTYQSSEGLSSSVPILMARLQKEKNYLANRRVFVWTFAWMVFQGTRTGRSSSHHGFENAAKATKNFRLKPCLPRLSARRRQAGLRRQRVRVPPLGGSSPGLQPPSDLSGGHNAGLGGRGVAEVEGAMRRCPIALTPGMFLCRMRRVRGSEPDPPAVWPAGSLTGERCDDDQRA